MTKTIAVIGGDGRYLELIRQLKMLPDTTIHLAGYDNLDQGFTGLKQMEFTDLEPEELDAVILPITGTDDEGIIHPVFSDQLIQLSYEWFQRLKPGAQIFTGIANQFLNHQTEQAQKQLIPLLSRDDVAIYNSIPTAEGAIIMAIENTDYTIHGSRVIVTGFGRVGHTVANKFSALGAKVSVASRHIKDLSRITEMGLNAIPLSELSHHTNACDILINTIPSDIVTKEEIQYLPSHALIFDLASHPGGTDFDYAKQRGIKAILAKSLPGIVAPKTSGQILADVIKHEFND